MAVGLVLLVAAQVYLTGQPMDPLELSQRCQQATPAWTNYDEDIKAQIGARPFAEWRGEPISAVREAGAIAVTFRISGVWAERDAAMPVLMRNALGSVQRDRNWQREGDHVVYRFPVDDDSAALALDSIEVRYPHHTRRLLVQERTPT